MSLCCIQYTTGVATLCLVLWRAVLCPAAPDYAEVITEIRTSVPGAAHSPVIGFGGSYGGMLATWMRLKVSHISHAIT